VNGILFSREWAMPSGDTFSVPPIGKFVQKYLAHSGISVDPFARNTLWATYTNDLNPNTSAAYHMDAEEFLKTLAADVAGLVDLAILDPPYSPRQISECYSEAGLKTGMKDTQNAALYSRVKAALAPLLSPSATVLSFGWNSAGMGKKYGFVPVEYLLVAHGGAHNDTICVAERRGTESASAAGIRGRGGDVSEPRQKCIDVGNTYSEYECQGCGETYVVNDEDAVHYEHQCYEEAA
jgi:hypothetical protein